jgi:hypothetical protein
MHPLQTDAEFDDSSARAITLPFLEETAFHGPLIFFLSRIISILWLAVETLRNITLDGRGSTAFSLQLTVLEGRNSLRRS